MNTKNPHLLLVDNDRNLLATLKDILKVKGFKPLPARTGKEALALAEMQEVAVALIDLHLEDMPGLDVLRLVRERSPSTECILLTGHASQDSAIEAINLGAYAYFQKPFDIEQLILTIQRAVEKRQSAKALAESQARYHTFINATTDMAFLKDDKFRYVLVNETNARYFGKSVEEVIGRDDFALMDKKGARACRESDQQALQENGLVITVEEVDGRFYETRKFPVHLQDGRLGVGGYVRDISESKQAEEKIKEREVRYRSLFEDSPISLWEEDFSAVKRRLDALQKRGVKDFRAYLRSHPKIVKECAALVKILDVNKASLDLYRARSKAELLKNLTAIFCDASYENFREELVQIAEGRTQFNWEGVNQTLDGKQLHINMNLLVAPTNTSDLSKVIISLVDVTERWQAEEALRQEQDLMRALMDNIPDAIYFKDTQLRFTRVNQATAHKHELDDPEQLIGKTNLDFFARESAQEYNDYEKKIIRSGNPVVNREEQEFWLNRPPSWVSTTEMPLRDERGQIIGLFGISRDISERKRAEQDLQEAESKLRAIVEQVPAIVYTESADQQRATLYISPQIKLLTGYTPAEWTSDQDFWKKVIHPDDREMAVAEDERTTKTGEPFRVEYRILTRDGRTLWILDEAVLIRDVAGQPLFWQGIMHDISERKKAEASLRESEERYRMLAENMSDTVWLMDMGLKNTYISPSVTKLRGYTLEELNALPLEKQMVPDSFQKALQLFVEVLSPENLSRGDQTISRSIELELYRKDGTSFWSENTFTLIREPDGTPKAILGSGHDISERKKVQEALENSEKRFRALIENSSDVITLLDPRGKILYNSPSYQNMMGHEPRARVGKNVFDTIHPEDQSEVTQTLNDVVMHPGQSRSLTFRARHKNGSWRWLETTASNMLGEPAIQGIVVNIRDITQRWQAEQELRQSEEKFRNIVEQSVDGITLMDEEGKIIAWNRGQAEITQLKPEEAIGRKLWDVQFQATPPELQTTEAYKHSEANFQEILLNSQSPLLNKVYENILYNKNGEQRIVQTLSFSIQAEKGHMICSISRDVTEKKKAEEIISRRVAELEVLYENGLAISGLLDEQEIGQHLIDVIGEKLGWQHAVLRLLDPGTGRAQVLAFNIPRLSGDEKKSYIERLNTTISKTGQGLSGWVIQHGQPVRSGNVLADERYVQSFPDIRSGMYVPLKTGNLTIGSLAVESTEPENFSEQDERLLMTVAAQAAVTIRNARSYQDALHNANHNAAMHQAGLEIVRAGNDLESIYAALQQAVEKVMISEAFTISFVNEARSEIRGVYLIDKGKRHPEAVFPIEGLNGQVVNSGKPLRFADLKQEEKLEFVTFGSEETPCSYLAVPLLAGGRVIGVISTQSYQPNRYSAEDQALLETLASEAVMAIENARLFVETQKRLRYISIVHNIDAAINASVDLNITLSIILENITKEINVDAAALLLMNPYTQTLEYNASRGFRTRIVEGIRIRLGEGLAGKAASQRQFISLADVETSVPDMFESEKFVAQYAIPLIAKGQVHGVLQIFHRSYFEPDQEWISFLNTLAGQAAIAVDNSRLFENLQRSNLDLMLAYDATIQGWSKALDLRDKETEGHSQRVTNLTLDLAAAVGIRDAETEHIRRGALLHDIGKIGIPDAILFKPAAFTTEEWEIMHKHPVNAYELIQPIAYLRPALDIPYCHHEKWDGSGYPRGLKGEQIPLAARVFAVVDVWDALTSDRPYRTAWSEEKALVYIREQSGQHFDPQVVEAFLMMNNK